MIINELILKQLTILLLSAVKFLIAAPASYMFGYSYFHTILNTTLGGWAGVAFFYFFSKYIYAKYPVWKQHIRNTINPSHLRMQKNTIQPIKPPKRIFTKKNRFIIKIRERYGLIGLIILTPVLLSIPVGTFLITKYYANNKYLLVWLNLSVVLWSIVLSTFIDYLPFIG